MVWCIRSGLKLVPDPIRLSYSPRSVCLHQWSKVGPGTTDHLLRLPSRIFSAARTFSLYITPLSVSLSRNGRKEHLYADKKNSTLAYVSFYNSSSSSYISITLFKSLNFKCLKFYRLQGTSVVYKAAVTARNWGVSFDSNYLPLNEHSRP